MADSLRFEAGQTASFVALTAVLALQIGWPPGASAKAPDPQPSVQLPRGYVAERVGSVRWAFPKSAKSAVEDLQKVHRSAWEDVTDELGGNVASEMEIRVALNPTQMQGMAPQGTTLPAYAVGVAFPRAGLVLLTLTAPETWYLTDLKTVLVHELSHLALHRATGGTPLPRWFAEGLATYQADEQSFTRMRVLWEGTIQGRLMRLEELSTAFPGRHHRVNLAYAQAADFVAFLTDGQDNRDRFQKLVANLRGGKDFSDAFVTAYQLPLGYLEREWRKALQQRFGRWPLLLTGLGTIWVMVSGLLLVAYVRARRKQAGILRRWAEEEAAQRKASTGQSIALRPSPPSSPPLGRAVPARRDSDVPTVEYEGRNHTLH